MSSGTEGGIYGKLDALERERYGWPATLPNRQAGDYS